MASKLDNMVPWGRSFDEYVDMFCLTDDDLKKEILRCSDGPASFNAELTARGGHVISADPVYRFGKTEIENRINKVAQNIIGQVRENHE
jgi:hypothetical protein